MEELVRILQWEEEKLNPLIQRILDATAQDVRDSLVQELETVVARDIDPIATQIAELSSECHTDEWRAWPHFLNNILATINELKAKKVWEQSY